MTCRRDQCVGFYCDLLINKIGLLLDLDWLTLIKVIGVYEKNWWIDVDFHKCLIKNNNMSDTV